MNTPTTQVAAATPKKRGCLFYGCLTVLVLACLSALGIYFGIEYLFSNVIQRYTSTTQLTLPTSHYNPADYPALKARLKEFTTGVSTGTGPKELSLTQDEINAIISSEPDLKEIKNMLFVQIQGDQLGGKISIPFDGLGFPGRFLTGEAKFKVALENGMAEVQLNSLVINGAELSQTILDQLNKTDIIGQIYKERENREAIKKLESISTKDGRLIIVRR